MQRLDVVGTETRRGDTVERGQVWMRKNHGYGCLKKRTGFKVEEIHPVDVFPSWKPVRLQGTLPTKFCLLWECMPRQQTCKLPLCLTEWRRELERNGRARKGSRFLQHAK